MNYFEFGFFDELEKIATNKDAVRNSRENTKFWDKVHKSNWSKQLSKRELGDMATRSAQAQRRTTSRLNPDTERRWDKDGKRIPPVHEVPGWDSDKGFGGYYAALSTPEAEKKFYERQARQIELDKKYRTQREHRRLFSMIPSAKMKAYGFVDRGFWYR